MQKVEQSKPGLRSNCLNFTEVTSMAIALISPTMTAALIVPLMYGNAGNASWLAYAFGTVMLLFVALNLNQFAKRSTSAGSMYAYTVMGLGTTAGNLSGWCLVWAYLFIGTAGMTGFTIFASTLLGMAGIHVPQLLLFALCAGTIWMLAYKDIQLSSILMLVLEGYFGGADLAALRNRAVRPEVDRSIRRRSNCRARLLGRQPGRRGRDLQPGRIRVRHRVRRRSQGTAADHPARGHCEPAPDRRLFRAGLLHRSAGLHRLQNHARQGRRAAQSRWRYDERRMAEGADFRRCDDQLLLAGAVVPELRRAHSLSDGAAGHIPCIDRQFA